jgi:hypothetical protein
MLENVRSGIVDFFYHLLFGFICTIRKNEAANDFPFLFLYPIRTEDCPADDFNEFWVCVCDLTKGIEILSPAF